MKRNNNDVLVTAKGKGIFEAVGKEKAREFAMELVKIGRDYDCNDGEVLEDIGEELEICYYCLKEANDIEDGLCKECRG
jgi:hypothetical protein